MPSISQRETELLNEIARLRRNQEREETKESAAGTAGGATTFLGLNDTPSAYTGSAGAFLRVGAGTASVIFGTVDYTDLYNVPTTFAPSAHGSTHWAAGTDPIGTATPTADAIPYADGSGLLDAWISLAGTATLGKAAFSNSNFIVTGGTVSIGTVDYSALTSVPSTFAPSAHASSHQNGGGDEIATATPGANAIIKADADGKIGAGWIDDADINLDNVTEGTTNKFFTATDETKLGTIEDNADVTDAGNVGAAIHGATAKTTPVDADTMPLIDSAASNVLKKVTWANIRATLNTYFAGIFAAIANGVTNGDSHDHSGGDGAQIDHGGTGGLTDDDHTQYALLAGRSGGQRITGVASTGYALEVYRNLAAASTDSPVMLVHQDNASDDQAALSVIQDASSIAAILVRRTGAGMLLDAGTLTLTEGSNVFGTGLYRASADDTQVTMSIIRSVAGSTIYNGGVDGDTFRRITILADGTFSWGPGNATRDTNLYRNGADHLKTDDDLIVGGDLSVGVDAAQGKLHAHDGTGGFLFVTKTSITGTAQTIIPNGTGDVVRGATINGVYYNSNGDFGNASWAGLANGSSFTIDIGGGGTQVLTIAIAASGALTVQRTAGSYTWSVALHIVWL